MSFKKLLSTIMEDIKVDLSSEFDENFRRKAFFNERWKKNKIHNSKGSQMIRSGRLRNSIKGKVKGNQIRWRSNVAYAKILNEGGEIVVTKKMKSFFWAMYYKANGGAVNAKYKNRRQRLTREAEKWKALALQPLGKVVKVEKRQFIGEHSSIIRRIDNIVKRNIAEYSKSIVK